ncbi:chromosome segregation protein SMC [Mesorhizobium sp. RP14(2022)]|uniref:Chromosome partition protein Smc n=1 Tax=Mesorhizobium liriopis TaxID=2953882 RepID=A0ABT1C166_9HYPH|nr:chromosome segregation protein SMC [Mesorhizobium liriopis]
MKFTRLRILGFKSFVEPADFVIEKGLTAVVGPNGCGKSNLVEALRWVMGESSYKNMRASGMDDVIFSGSGNRPSRNTAEVTLFLDNADRTAPAAFNGEDELQVSRRIERQSGSTYRINGREARARDVQLLFADQSTGARSPSMVGQGRVSELIQAKPQARRALLEEAAGISGLHSRRHEAELRLKAAETNLERLDDVAGELEGQIESLKRQARQAVRYKNLAADIKRGEATVLHLRWLAAKAAQDEARKALDRATLTVAERANAQTQAARDQAVNLHGLPALREKEAEEAAVVARLNIQRMNLDEEAARICARQTEVDRLLREIAADLAREEAIARDNQDVIGRLDTEEKNLRSSDEAAVSRLARAIEAEAAARATLALSEAAMVSLTAEHAQATAERNAAERALAEADQRLSRARAEQDRIERDVNDVAAKLAALVDPTAIRTQLEEAERQLLKAEADAAATEARVAEAREAEAGLRPALTEAKATLARLEGEARVIRKLIEQLGGGKSFPPVLESILVERGFEAALGAALGSDLDAPTDAAAKIHWAGSQPHPSDPALPEGTTPLSEHVRGPRALSRRLAQVGVVPDLATGKRLQAELAPGQRLVSREGAFWRWDGLMAAADAPSSAAQRLAQKNRLFELETETTQAKAEHDRQSALAVEAERETRAASDAAEAARGTMRDQTQALATLRAALKRAEEAAGGLTLRAAALDEALTRAKATVALEEDAQAGARNRRDAAPDPRVLRERTDAAYSTVARDRSAQSNAQGEIDRLKREKDGRARRLQAIAGERQSWLSRVETASRQLSVLSERKAQAEREQAMLAEAPDELAARRRTLTTELASAEEARNRAADKVAEAETRQTSFDRAAASAAQSLSQAREERARAEERLNATDARRAEVEARITDELGVEPHKAIELAGLSDKDPLPDQPDVERRIERLKFELERLGAVNLRAEEEARELGGRFDLIVREREDVIEAVRKLRGAIGALNREGRERLLAAFQLVNTQFQRLFTHLFGGGTAELVLVESDDPLQAGLEIMARPPGKKPQTMTLLSGGEQALTAMSLIFAVFLTNPAPVCVLDEVDAPLDDHNVERFCNLLDEMSRTTETRFIVITHNPITMARMDRLFGVTMAEQGVSQLVSVDLQTAETIRETA